MNHTRRTHLFHLLALSLVSLSATACAATSDYMRPMTQPRPIAAPPDAATVVFIRPSAFAAGIKTTLVDSRGIFLGDSLPESHFAITLPPGHYVFFAWAENTSALQATLAPGRIYFVEVAPKPGWLSARVHLLAITPRSHSWAKVNEWLGSTTQLWPDMAGGMAYLASRSQDVNERIRRAKEALYNYDPRELEERTLRPEDGR